MNERYAEKLSRMIQKETVSADGQTDLGKFYEFHDLLRELFPALFSVCQFRDHNGSILMRWPGKEHPEPAKQGLLLMNHFDVVEAAGEWEHPPFSGEIADGRVWGRGTLDDKGPLFAMLQAAEELVSEGFVPEKDIWFESACTEEIMGEGADTISKWLQEQGYRFEMVLDEGGAILTEPIGGAKGDFAMIGVGEKGCADIKFIAKSQGGHASAPPKNTPLVRLGKFMSYIDRSEIFDVQLSPVICEMLRRLAPHMEGMSAKAMAQPERFAPLIKRIMAKSSPTAGALLKTTIAFTRACGSGGNNVIPDEAWVIGNMRYSHHQGQEKSIEAVTKAAKRYGIETEVLDPGFESPVSDWNGRAFRLVEEAVGKVFPGTACSPYLMTGASDSRFMSRVSSSCIRFAPFHLSDEQMASIHGCNENVDVRSLVPAVQFYQTIIRSF
ncbi:MAG: M20/M25/M40 family metallo-hydrolase [Firmicutes bacterium]|nr:M20/M25/M40 family metallo-hydrolase [Bacillota bacterium]